MQCVNDIAKLMGITNRKVINQVMEYLRLLKIKTNFRTKNELSRIVICLDISGTKADEKFNVVSTLTEPTMLFSYKLNSFHRIDAGQRPAAD